ncbi:hypothetical protein VTN96DRAFT_4163 [Rasamsonia emersonii]
MSQPGKGAVRRADSGRPLSGDSTERLGIFRQFQGRCKFARLPIAAAYWRVTSVTIPTGGPLLPASLVVTAAYCVGCPPLDPPRASLTACLHQPAVSDTFTSSLQTVLFGGSHWSFVSDHGQPLSSSGQLFPPIFAGRETI